MDKTQLTGGTDVVGFQIFYLVNKPQLPHTATVKIVANEELTKNHSSKNGSRSHSNLRNDSKKTTRRLGGVRNRPFTW